MNINGHEIEKHGQWYDVDGYEEWSTSTSAEFIEGFVRRIEAKAARARALIEHRRREAAEKDEREVADELDRRAEVARIAWNGMGDEEAPWMLMPESYREAWRNVVRALDADTATQEARS